MEPDVRPDKASSRNFSSKIDFFNSQMDQKREKPVRKKTAADKSGSTKTQKAIMTPKLETERSTTTPKLGTERSTTTPKLETERSTTTSKLETERSTTTPKLETERSTTTPKLETERSTTTSKLGTEKSTTTPKLETERSTTTSKLETERSTTSPKLETERSTTTSKLETERSTTTPKLETERSDRSHGDRPVCSERQSSPTFRRYSQRFDDELRTKLEDESVRKCRYSQRFDDELRTKLEDESVRKCRYSQRFDDELRTKLEDESVRKCRYSQRFDDELRTKLEDESVRKCSGFSPNDLKIFQKPMCLVSTDKENLLTIETDALEQISTIDWPIVVVAIAGLYRTGKSYLMNCLAGSTTVTGFALGNTVKSETKGIWVWCKVHPEKSNTVLLLLDTEGLGDVQKGDPSHDNKLFTLATLLCNTLVYNMKGVLDQDAISKLTFVTKLAENIRFQGDSRLILPDFVLCIRDFSLKLYLGDQKLTEDEYLAKGLATEEDKDDTFNKPRECIRNYFPVRKCFTLPVPGDGDVLENLDTLRFSDLSNKFKEATKRFISYIYTRKPKELLVSKPITGQMFTTLANHYVNAMRHGAVPDVDDAFTAVAKIENSRVEKEAFDIFAEHMQSAALPIPSDVLDTCYTKAQQKALNHLRTNVVHDKSGGHFEIQAKMKMDNLWNTMKDENAAKVQAMFCFRLEVMYQETVVEKIENMAYVKAGGYREFRRDIDRMKENFHVFFKMFKEHEICSGNAQEEMASAWFTFMTIIKEDETRIIETDDALSKQEKEDEQRRNEENIKKLIKEYKQGQADALEKQRQTMEKHYEQLDQKRTEHFKKETEKLETFYKSKLENQQAQQNQLLEKQQKEHEEKQKRFMDEQTRRLEETIRVITQDQREALEKAARDRYNEMLEQEDERRRKEHDELKASIDKLSMNFKEETLKKQKVLEDERRTYKQREKEFKQKEEEYQQKEKERKSRGFFRRLFYND